VIAKGGFLLGISVPPRCTSMAGSIGGGCLRPSYERMDRKGTIYFVGSLLIA